MRIINFALSLFLYLSIFFSLSFSVVRASARSVSVLLAVYFSRVTRPRVGVFSLSFRSLSLSLFHSSCVVCSFPLSLVPVMCMRACVCVCCSRDRLLSAAFEAQLPHAALSYRRYSAAVCILCRLFMSGVVRAKSARVASHAYAHADAIDGGDNRFPL